MTPSDVADLFDNNPDTAFRLTLNSGDVIDVLSPRRAIVDFTGMLHVAHYSSADARVAHRSKFISVINIALIEPIDPRAPRGGRRRK